MPRCKECRDKFEPKYFNQKYCMDKDECIKAHVEYAKQQKAKAWKKEKKERKEKLKTRTDHLNELQKIFNKYIRLRDEDKPCISCGTQAKVQFDAGHYRSVGAHPELRFNEDNVHKQCRKCNGYWGGKPIEYRKNLIKKIGQNKVEFLERNDHEPLKLSVDEIKAMKKKYRKKIKDIVNK